MNGDGNFDPGEPGIVGVTIYADLNDNNVRDLGEPWTVTMPQSPTQLIGDADSDGFVGLSDLQIMQQYFGTSNATFAHGDFNSDGIIDTNDFLVWLQYNGSKADVLAGEYTLEYVPVGQVKIREVVPSGYYQTYPEQGYHVVELSQDQSIVGIDFGNQEAHPATIHGRKVHDQYEIGHVDDGELGIGNVVIYVDLNDNGTRDNYQGALEPAGTTDASGNYSITNVPPGHWKVRELVPAGYTQSYPAALLTTLSTYRPVKCYPA